MSTRFDPDNCIALCYYCHLWKFEKEKQGAYRTMMIEWLGRERFDELTIKAEMEVKRSDAIKELMSWIKEYMKERKIISRWQWKSGTYWPDVMKREKEDADAII